MLVTLPGPEVRRTPQADGVAEGVDIASVIDNLVAVIRCGVGDIGSNCARRQLRASHEGCVTKAGDSATCVEYPGPDRLRQGDRHSNQIAGQVDDVHGVGPHPIADRPRGIEHLPVGGATTSGGDSRKGRQGAIEKKTRTCLLAKPTNQRAGASRSRPWPHCRRWSRGGSRRRRCRRRRRR